jgi:hypothetical protein
MSMDETRAIIDEPLSTRETLRMDDAQETRGIPGDLNRPGFVGGSFA